MQADTRFENRGLRQTIYLNTADHDALDTVARSEDFYFAGISPVLEDAEDYPFR